MMNTTTKILTNLFSIFDPSTSMFSLSWFSLGFPIWLMVSLKSKKSTKWTISIKKMLIPFVNELTPILKDSIGYTSLTKMMIMMFFTIFILNFSSMLPFLFTPTAHMMTIFPTALSIWFSMMLFGWLNKPGKMLAHTVPSGTPIPLANFMVVIELVSNMIRPLTLSIRLTANMVAGHLLMSLLGNFILMFTSSYISSYLIFMVLFLLESAVSFIQAYVFMTLLSLYLTEIN